MLSGFILETLIKKRLKELIMDFEPESYCNKKLVSMAAEDMSNYLKIIWGKEIGRMMDETENFPKEEQAFNQVVYAMIEKDINGVVADLNIFMSLWYGKWKQRTQLVNCKQDVSKFTTQVIRGSNLMQPEEVKTYMLPAVEMLIKLGEYAGTEVIAEQLIKRLVGKTGKVPSTPKDSIEFTRLLLKDIKDVALSCNKIIFINIDKVKFE